MLYSVWCSIVRLNLMQASLRSCSVGQLKSYVQLSPLLTESRTVAGQGGILPSLHDQVLRKLAEILEGQRQKASREHPPPADQHILFVEEGKGGINAPLVTQNCNISQPGQEASVPHSPLWSSSTKTKYSNLVKECRQAG